MREALDSVRPYMESHGGDVELVGIDDGVARIRLEGQLRGLPGVGLDARAGDQAGARGGRARSRRARGRGRRGEPPDRARRRRARAAGREGRSGEPDAEPCWFDVDGLDDVAEGELRGVRVAGVEIVVARVDGSLLAYRDACAGCGSRIAAGRSPATFSPAAPASAGTTSPAPAGRSTTTASSSSPCRCSDLAGGPRGSRLRHERGARPAARGPAPRRARGEPAPDASPPGPGPPANGARRVRTSAATCAATSSARPPSPAPPDRAPDPLRLRELLGPSLRRRGATAHRHPRRLARRPRADARALGRVRDPDRTRLLHARQRRRRRRRLLSEPRRGDRVGARHGGVGGARSGEPGARRPRARHRGA